MTRVRRRRRQEQSGDEEATASGTRPRPEPTLIGVQQRAGNRAAAAVVQRGGPVPVVIQRAWYELLDDDSLVEHEGDKPPAGQFKPMRNHTPGKSVWKRKGAAPPTYAQLLGIALPNRDDHATVFTVDATLVRFSQDSIGAEFKDKSKGMIDSLRKALVDGKVTPNDLEPLRVTMRSGRLVSLDNRRLWACRQAGVQVRCAWATDAAIAERDFTAGKDGSTTIRVRPPAEND